MKVIARNLTDPLDGFLQGKRYVLMDRDGKFCPAFRDRLKDEGVKPLLLPARSPDLNAYIERFMRSIKSECLWQMIFFGEKSLRRAIGSYLEHYHAERNHQGLENKIIEPGEEVRQGSGEGKGPGDAHARGHAVAEVQPRQGRFRQPLWSNA